MNDDTYWVTYKEIFLDSLETRFPGSEHPMQVRRILDRFTKYGRLIARRLKEIDNRDVTNYVALRQRDEWRGKKLAVRTINNEIAALNTCFAFAGPKEPRGPGRKFLGLIAQPPYFEPLAEGECEPVAVDQTWIERFLAAVEFAVTPWVEGCTPQQFWPTALLLDLVTGLRRAALLRVPRPTDQDLFERRVLHLPKEFSKTKKGQWIPLGTSEVAEILGALPTREGEPLLPWKRPSGRRMTDAHFNFEMRRFQRVAGIGDAQRLKTKYLRSTAATELAEKFSDAIAKRRLGHSATTNTLAVHYQARRVTDDDVRASAHLSSLVLPFIRKPPELRIAEEAV